MIQIWIQVHISNHHFNWFNSINDGHIYRHHTYSTELIEFNFYKCFLFMETQSWEAFLLQLLSDEGGLSQASACGSNTHEEIIKESQKLHLSCWMDIQLTVPLHLQVWTQQSNNSFDRTSLSGNLKHQTEKTICKPAILHHPQHSSGNRTGSRIAQVTVDEPMEAEMAMSIESKPLAFEWHYDLCNKLLTTTSSISI